MKPDEGGIRNLDDTPFDNFWNFLKNKTQSGGSKIQESVVSSSVLHLNKTSEGVAEESTRIQMYPAVAVVINTFGNDGKLKTSMTHFQPDFNAFTPETNGKGAEPSFNFLKVNLELNSKRGKTLIVIQRDLLFKATHISGGKNSNKAHKNPNNREYTVGGFIKGSQNPFPEGVSNLKESHQGISWPFANYFPIVINDPFLSVYNAFATSVYNAVSSMVEYGPEADISAKNNERRVESDRLEVADRQRGTVPARLDRYQVSTGMKDSNIFDEVVMRSDSFKRTDRKPLRTESEGGSIRRKRRDATSIYVQSRDGGTVGITLEEPAGSIFAAVNTPDERARSFSPVLVNTPPLSTILRPPQQGYADKKRKTKPSKPIKEEGSSEEVGEEHEEESTSVENANEGVAISPPPEGASVAEAKPIGLAIAGPGGVAASKPQGTAVAGPGGLAIARPVGTAIAGVEVEGSVPIGGQQKHKKKPKQEQEQTDADLHYVGGLTGPIGNPQPKEFADSIYYKTVKETEGNNIQENFLLRGRPNINGFQLKLGQQNGKYGFIPMFANPIAGEAVPQKRMDFPIFFHGLLGNNGQGFDQFQNFRAQF